MRFHPVTVGGCFGLHVKEDFMKVFTVKHYSHTMSGLYKAVGTAVVSPFKTVSWCHERTSETRLNCLIAVSEILFNSDG